MKVFGIGDLHLSATGEKPMDIFGPAWVDHQEKIERNWRAAVAPEDLVLICGDLSWAIGLEAARPDLDFIDSLPGVKYFIRGNHDYWFSSPTQVRRALGPSMHLIRFDAAVHRGVGVCGVRAWPWPGHPEYDPAEDQRHWSRALIRLGLSLDALRALQWEVAVAMFHYPPRDHAHATELSRMIAEAGVRYCIYGHLHGEDAAHAFEAEVDAVLYRCVSADRLEFRPALLLER
ncbi:MAG: metallophosphoesterase [Planctomycetota bacterium]|jgi:predicted phosphohydrolase